MDASDAPPTHGRPTDLDLQILDLLREDAKSAGRLAEVLTHEGERVDPEAVRLRLRALARRGLVVVGSPANPRADAGVGGSARADLWEITEEGRALAESQAGVARAPYERDVGGEGGGRAAGFWVLVAIATLTVACAAYSLLTATGVLGALRAVWGLRRPRTGQVPRINLLRNENRCIKGGGTIPTVSELNGRADAKYPAGTIFGTHGDVRTVGLRQHGRLEAVPGDRSQGY
jgi:hypothetical protein